MPAMIDTKTCTGCGRCDRSCPLDVIYYNKDAPGSVKIIA